MDSLVLAFDRFGRDCLALETATGGGVADFLRCAIRHYLSEVDSDRVAIRVPSFVRSRLPAPEFQIGLELDQADLARLTATAEHQGVAVEELCRHAALLYLSDIEAGLIHSADGDRGGLELSQRVSGAGTAPVV
jgi:hypothetical protein